MDTLKLGQLIEGEQQRDATHIAVAPVVAFRSLSPGEPVGLNEKGEADNLVKETIGIIDPFLKARVPRGEKCWLFLYPGTVTGLRHEWTHPAFEPSRISHAEHETKSHAWIAQHAAALGLTPDVLMDNAASWLDDSYHIVQQGSERWRDTFSPTEFWHHYEIVTGKVVPQDMKQSFYCCSC